MRSEFIVVLSVHVGNQVRYRVFKETVVYPKTFFCLWEHKSFMWYVLTLQSYD